jgi:hypothetical protein
VSGTKLVVILLVLILVLFVVFEVWHPNSKQARFDPDSHPLISGLGNLFGPPGPKLKPSELTPNPPPIRRLHSVPVTGKFVLSAGDQPTQFDISPDSKSQFRQATFAVNRHGCATIRYRTADGSGGKLNDKTWPNDGEDPKNPTKVTFQILSAKGLLAFTFVTPDCTVQLE